ncbi:MAG TPA: hypothetical protein VGA55_00830, partial [Bacteroidota bacterium]
MKPVLIISGVAIALMLTVPENTHAQNRSRTSQVVTFSVLRTVTAADLSALSALSAEKKITVAAVIEGREMPEAVSVPSAYLAAADFHTRRFQRSLRPEIVVVTISD